MLCCVYVFVCVFVCVYVCVYGVCVCVREKRAVGDLNKAIGWLQLVGSLKL